MLKRHRARQIERLGKTAEDLREHTADRPSEIPKRGWREIIKRTREKLKRDNTSILAAGVAFFILSGLVPGLVALISIYGLISDPNQVQEHFASLSGFLPGAVRDILEDQMTRIAGNAATAGWGAAISIPIAIWGASKSMKAVINGLNIAYEEKEKRGFIKLTATTLGLTLCAVLTGIVAIISIVALPKILGVIGIENANVIANAIRWPLLALLAVVGLSALYRFGPSRTKPKWRWMTWGSALAMVLWVAGSAAFSLYVAKFGKFNETYGSLGAIIIFLLWLHLSAFVVLLGAELNTEIEHQKAGNSDDFEDTRD